jgi:microcystin-dependent protein
MEFRFPFDEATGQPGDGSTPWRNSDPIAGIEGSIAPAEAFNDTQREIANAIDGLLGDGTEGSGQDVADLTQLLQAIQSVGALTGEMKLWTSTVAPTGWLFVNGATVLRADHPNLWAHAQGSGMLHGDDSEPGMFGPGDGSTTFKLPDVRGRFIRALDQAAGVDAARTIGSFQDQEIQHHGHVMQTIVRSVFDSTGGTAGYGHDSGPAGPNVPIADYEGAADETRPANLAYPYIIKT